MRPEFSGNITKCHQHLHDILTSMGFQVTDNAEAGPYKIDCLIESNFGFEADGHLYHGWKSKDEKRDYYIESHFGTRIMRIPEALLTGSSDGRVKKMIMEFISDKPESDTKPIRKV